MGVLQIAGITCLKEKEKRTVQKFHQKMSRPSLNFITMWSSSSCVVAIKSVKISKDSAISSDWKASKAEGLLVNFCHRDLVIRWSNWSKEKGKFWRATDSLNVRQFFHCLFMTYSGFENGFFVKSMFVHLIQNLLTTVGIHHVA